MAYMRTSPEDFFFTAPVRKVFAFRCGGGGSFACPSCLHARKVMQAMWLMLSAFAFLSLNSSDFLFANSSRRARLFSLSLSLSLLFLLSGRVFTTGTRLLCLSIERLLQGVVRFEGLLFFFSQWVTGLREVRR